MLTRSAVALVALRALPLGVACAQTPAAAVSICEIGQVGGGPACPFERRLVIDVRLRGNGVRDRGQVLLAVGLAGAQVGITVLPLDRAAAADSALYAVLEVARDTAGGYRFVTFLAGPRAPRPPAVDVCRSSAAGTLGDITFGAYLAGEVVQLTRCTQARRLAAR